MGKLNEVAKKNQNNKVMLYAQNKYYLLEATKVEEGNTKYLSTKNPRLISKLLNLRIRINGMMLLILKCNKLLDLHNNKKTKHIHYKYYKVRECIELGLFDLIYIESNLNIADIFTKALERGLFQKLKQWLLLINI